MQEEAPESATCWLEEDTDPVDYYCWVTWARGSEDPQEHHPRALRWAFNIPSSPVCPCRWAESADSRIPEGAPLWVLANSP